MGWSDANPVDNIEVPRVQEQEIVPLTLQEVEKLEQTAEQPQHRAMRTSLHLMLYCGLLPNEVARLRPDDIQLQEKWVLIHPPPQLAKPLAGAAPRRRILPLGAGYLPPHFRQLPCSAF